MFLGFDWLYWFWSSERHWLVDQHCISSGHDEHQAAVLSSLIFLMTRVASVYFFGLQTA